MRKMMIAALAALSLSACAPTGIGSTPAPPSATAGLSPILAPLTKGHVARETIDLAFATADAALYGIDFMRSVGWIEDGTPKAHAIADAAESVKRWLKVADDAQRKGEQPQADAAFAQASAAYAALLAALER